MSLAQKQLYKREQKKKSLQKVPAPSKKLSLGTSAFDSLLSAEDLWLENEYITSSSFSLTDTWKTKKRNWGHSLHSMASRSGSFPAALADYFIQHFSNEGDIVLDPFSGKGTTALQSCLANRVGVGVDIAPEAYILTAAKTVAVNHDEAVAYLDEFKFSKSKKLIKKVPDEVKVFYDDEVLAQIMSFREQISEDYSLRHISYIEDAPSFELEIKKKEKLEKNKKRALYAQYWMGVMMGILHGSSELSLSISCSHSFSMSPGYVRNYAKKHGLVKPKRDLKECLIAKSEKLQADGANEFTGRSILGSAMDLPNTLTNKVDLIVTSPPYFTAQTYAWDNWLREWFLGFNFKEVRTQLLHTNVEDKYSNAMQQNLAEAYRVLKKGSWAFYVVGDVIKKSAKGDKHIITANIIAEEAAKVGFSTELIINDDIPPTSRYNSAFLKKGQGLKLDRIVCLYKK